MSEELKNIPATYTPPVIKISKKVADKLFIQNDHSPEKKLMMRMNCENNTAMMVESYANLMAANSPTIPVKESEIRMLLESYRKTIYGEIMRRLEG